MVLKKVLSKDSRYISAQQKKQDTSTLVQSYRKVIENGIGSKKIKKLYSQRKKIVVK